MMRVLVTEGLSAAGLDLLRERLEVVEAPDLGPADLRAALQDADAVIVRSKTRLDPQVLDGADRLKVIGRAGVGHDNIDLEAASRRGILVMNVPDASTISACEHTFALVFALVRKIPDAVCAMRERRFARDLVGRELYGKTLGVVGLGKIGVEVAQRARAFGMKVIAHDPYITPERADAANVVLLPLADLLTAADVVTLHVPLTEATRHLLGRKELLSMRPGAFLVNCARGPIIDDEALVDVLSAGRLGGVALDVYATEPPDFSSRLLSAGFANLLCTPHLGASTEEAQERVSVMIARQVVKALLDQDFANSVNLPRISAEMLVRVRPYMRLAELLGRFLLQWIRTMACPFELALEGDAAGLDPDYVALAAQKGFLSEVTEGQVTYVNAPMLAGERGLTVTQVRRPASANWKSALVLTALSDPRVVVGGRLSVTGEPRLIQVNDYNLDFPLAGRFLVVEHEDRPGAVGRVGTILGNSRINIGRMEVCRQTEGARAMMILTVDSPLSERVTENLRELDDILACTTIDLVCARSTDGA